MTEENELSDEKFEKKMFDFFNEQDIVRTPSPSMAMEILKKQEDKMIILLFLVSNYGGGTRKEAWQKLKEMKPTVQELRFLKKKMARCFDEEEKEIRKGIENLL